MSDIVESLRDDLTTAALYGFHQRDDEVAALKAEIERLRGLLREAHLALSFMPDPTRKLLDLRYRIREALGE